MLDDKELQILRDACSKLASERLRLHTLMNEASNVAVRASETLRELALVHTALCLVIDRTIESKNGRN